MKPSVLTVLAVSSVLQVQSQPQSDQGQGGGEYRISADVDQVVLPVAVLDQKGRIVGNLDQTKFRVYEDGQPQKLSYFSHRDIPVSVGLVVDNSASMGPKRSDTVLAALHFVRLSNPEDEMFVVNFNERVSLGLPESEPFTSNAQDLRNALLSRPCTGKTALFDAIATGLVHLQRGSRDKKALIVISDGGDNASRHSFRDALDLAQKSNVIVYTIGLFDEADMDKHPEVLKKLARATGGEMFLPDRSSEIGEICGRIAHDLRNQYTLAYTPSNARHDGRYRRVEVVAVNNGRKLNARTRRGYFAPAGDAGRASR